LTLLVLRTAYCVSVKALFTTVGAKGVTVIELDNLADGAELQAALLESVRWLHLLFFFQRVSSFRPHAQTKQRTVPNVFVGGQHVGGNDATQELYRNGKLAAMLKAAGAL